MMPMKNNFFLEIFGKFKIDIILYKIDIIKIKLFFIRIYLLIYLKNIFKLIIDDVLFI